jgi:SAM-dependent methyltransferase
METIINMIPAYNAGKGMPRTDNVTIKPMAGLQKSSIYRSPFEDLAQEYDAWFDEEGSLIFLTEVLAVKKILSSLPKPWIEIGVGSGRFAHILGIETGIDPSINLIKMAKLRGVNAILGKGEHQIFLERSFGTVFIICSLCFMDSPLNVLKEAYRILIPGGSLVLGLILKESPWGYFYQARKAEGHRFYKYATLYGYDEVAALMKQAGFTTDRVISTLFQKPGDVRHMEKPGEGFSPDAGFTVIKAGKPFTG